jgi:hypothetical protein
MIASSCSDALITAEAFRIAISGLMSAGLPTGIGSFPA